MASETDTSREAVERLCEPFDARAAEYRRDIQQYAEISVVLHAKIIGILQSTIERDERVAATLRALLSERDAATARAEGAERERADLRAGVDEWYEKAVRYISERDAARAERDAARAFCERVATPCSEPLNSAWLYRDKESRRHFQAELRREARAALGAASAGEAIQGSVGKEAEGWPND